MKVQNGGGGTGSSRCADDPGDPADLLRSVRHTGNIRGLLHDLVEGTASARIAHLALERRDSCSHRGDHRAILVDERVADLGAPGPGSSFVLVRRHRLLHPEWMWSLLELATR